MPYTYRLPSGTWRIIVKHNGQTRTATGRTRLEVQRRGAQLLLDIGGTVDDNHLTVAQFIELASVERRQRWSPTYRADVDSILERLPTEFGDRLARDVTPTVVNALYRQLQRDGWTSHRLRRLHEILASAWHEAILLEHATDNPLRRVRKPAAADRELVIPDDDDVTAILAAATHPTERLALRLAATTGARRGEIVALRWNDIHLDTAHVVIRRSLAYTPATAITERDTKTGKAGHRVIAIDAPTRDALTAHHTRQKTQAVAAGLTARWVMSDDAGVTPWRPDRLTHVFSTARDRAGITGVRLHDLRHYVATSMLQDGVSPHDVAYQLGHSSEATTLRVYAHYMPGRGRESAERRAARLDA